MTDTTVPRRTAINNDEEHQAALMELAARRCASGQNCAAGAPEEIAHLENLIEGYEKWLEPTPVPKKNPHIGSSLESFLEEEGILEEVEQAAHEKGLRLNQYPKASIENDEDLVAAQAALAALDRWENEAEKNRLSTMIVQYIDQSHVIPEDKDVNVEDLPAWERQKLLAENGAFLESTFLYADYLDECFAKKEREARSIIAQYIQISNIDEPDSFGVIKGFFDKHYDRAARYHNWHHTCCMIVNVSEAYAYTKERDRQEWDLKEYRSLILAAAMHDIGHTGGHESDTINVARAIALASDFIRYARLDSQVDKALVISLIRVTEFPFVFEPKTELEKIIRDADLLQSLEPTWFYMIYHCLLAEIRVKRPMLKFTEFCKGQHDFMHNAQFYSLWWNEKKFGDFGGIALERAVMMKERAEKIVNPF